MERWRDSLPLRQMRARPLAFFAVAMLSGEIVAARWNVPLSLCLGCAAVILIAVGFLRRRRDAALALVMLLAAVLGMGRMTLAMSAYPPVRTRYSVTMVGRVDSDPFVHPRTGRVIARFVPETIEDEPGHLRLRLYLRGDDEEALSQIAYGQRLEVTGHIWANDPVTNPHEFDFGAYLHRSDMDCIATAKIEDVEILDAPGGLMVSLIELRHAVGRRIDEMFPESAGLVRALVLGDRSMIDEEVREGLSATGTAHLIAISGLHVTMLAFLLSAGLRLFMSARRAHLLTLGPLLFYGLLIGFPAPFTRALIMFAVLTLGQALGLPSDPVTRLCAALLGYLVMKPLIIGDTGFILSYTASAGILLLLPPLHALLRLDRLPQPNRRLPLRQRLFRMAVCYLPELFCASLAAQLATLPAVIASFGVQSVVALPFNLICVPLCMLGYLLALAALILSPLGGFVALPAEILLKALMAVTRFSATLPLTAVRVGRYPAILILAHAAVILAASPLSGLSIRRRRVLPLMLAVIAGLSSLNAWLYCLPFRVSFLDAGSADCAVLTTGGNTWIFDAGDTYTPIADYLNATSLHVNGVFLSHPHQDHAGGLSDILDSFSPDAVYVPKGWFEQTGITDEVMNGIDRTKAMGIPIVELSAGDELALSGDARLTVYNPDGDFAEVNDMSLLLLAECGGRSVLFTGDLTMEGEPAVIPDCDVLKVAHHGADNATSAEFLEAASPEIAVISVGENSYGHPGPLALRRLEDCGAEVLRTDEWGAITLTSDGGGWRIKTYLETANELE